MAEISGTVVYYSDTACQIFRCRASGRLFFKRVVDDIFIFAVSIFAFVVL